MEDLPPRYIPRPPQLLALKRQGLPTSAFPSRVRRRPWPDSPCCSTGRWPIPMPLLDALYEQRERAAIELQRLANDDALRLAEVAFNTHDGLLVMDHGGIILKVNDSFQPHHRLWRARDARSAYRGP